SPLPPRRRSSRPRAAARRRWYRTALPTGALRLSGLGARECEARIRLVAIEEMFAVEQHLTPTAHSRAHAVANRGEVFLRTGLERHSHVIIPRFRHETDGVGLSLEERCKPRIVRRRATGTTGHAERGKSCFKTARLSEQLCVR